MSLKLLPCLATDSFIIRPSFINPSHDNSRHVKTKTNHHGRREDMITKCMLCMVCLLCMCIVTRVLVIQTDTIHRTYVIHMHGSESLLLFSHATACTGIAISNEHVQSECMCTCKVKQIGLLMCDMA